MPCFDDEDELTDLRPILIDYSRLKKVDTPKEAFDHMRSKLDKGVYTK
jgi:hypothetical protein